MPQSPIASPPFGRPRYRVTNNPPTPSKDGALHAEGKPRRPEAARRGRAWLRRPAVREQLIIEIVAIVICPLGALAGALSLELFLAWNGEGDLYRLTGWEVDQPLRMALIPAVVWTIGASFCIAAIGRSVVATILGIPLFLIFGAVALFSVFLAVMGLVVAPLTFMIVMGTIVEQGFWLCFTVFVWFALMLSPLPLGGLLRG
ncbi:hypothetical protein ACEPPZ_11275 [Paracoccus yeei]|uniref:hypothetical protein n=1 Tax=Paracoccus yeei TaxID=147645 RepID=UPI0037CCE8E4